MPRLLASLLISLSIFSAEGETINVAVAANFRSTLQQIVRVFEYGQDDDIRLISGSSGKHYAQIINGAPFDLFLSADTRRPDALEGNDRVSPLARQTYAIGQLALWGRGIDQPPSALSLRDLSSNTRIAIANPELAPYGRAARDVLSSLGLMESLSGKLVMGENIAQTFQFVYSGSARLGFVALSQVQNEVSPESYWLVPLTEYEAIRQDMVLLSDALLARKLYEFLLSEEAQGILIDNGYLSPEVEKEE